MTFPNLITEVAFTTDPLATPVWNDVTADVRGGIAITKGRDDELNNVQPSTLTVTLDNRKRRYDPIFNAGLPYYDAGAGRTNVVPERRIRVSAVYSGTTYRLFTGFVDDWPQDYESGGNFGDSLVTVHATDAMKFFNETGLLVYGNEVLAEAPVAYWPMTDPAGAVTAADLGSNGQPLPLFGNPGRRSFTGLLGHPAVVNFDGVNDYGRLSAPNDALKIKGDLTLECWATVTSGSVAGTLISLVGNTNVEFYYLWQIDPVNNRMTFQYTNRSGVYQFFPSGAILTSGLNHLAVVRRMAAGQIEFWVNGVIVRTWAMSPLDYAYVNPATPMLLNVGDAAINGITAHAAIHASALSPDRLKTHYAAKVDALAAMSSGAAANVILDAIGWPAIDRNIDAGLSVIQQHVPDSNALNELQTIAVSEDGPLFIAGDGRVRFVGRDTLMKPNQQISVGNFGDDPNNAVELPYQSLTPSYAEKDLRNRIRIPSMAGGDGVAEDAASVARYRRRTLDGPASYLSALEAQDRANGWLIRYKDPAIRFEQMGVQVQDDRLWPQVLNRDLTDRLTVQRTPQILANLVTDSFESDTNVDGIADNWQLYNFPGTDPPATYALAGAGMGFDQFRSQKVTIGATNTNQKGILRPITTVSGWTYRIGIWVFLSQPGAVRIYVNDPTDPQQQTIFPANGWNNIFLSFKATFTGSRTVYLSTSASNLDVYFDLFTIDVTSGGRIIRDVRVQKVTHTIDTGKSWGWAVNLAPVEPVTYWILGDSTFGVMDTTTRFGF